MWRGLAVANDLSYKGVTDQRDSMETKPLLAGCMRWLVLDSHQRHVRYWLCEFSTELLEQRHAGGGLSPPGEVSVFQIVRFETTWNRGVIRAIHSVRAVPLRYVSFRVSSDGVYL